MKLQIYSIFDSATQGYIQPFFMQSEAAARRAFKNAASEVDHDFNKNAQDYTLFHLGEFDQSTGIHTILPAPISLGNALTFRDMSATPIPELQPTAATDIKLQRLNVAEQERN